MSDAREPSRNGTPGGFDGRVLTARDVLAAVNGQQELRVGERTIITPLAADELRSRGIRITRASASGRRDSSLRGEMAIAQEFPDLTVASAVSALRKDGLVIEDWGSAGTTEPGRWFATIARRLAAARDHRCVLFCQDPALACCIANRVPGVRAAAGGTAAARRAVVSIAVNLFAVAVPGPTFFELRQILRTMGDAERAVPASVTEVIAELERHADR